MAGTTPSIDRDALARLQLGDEGTLRRVFEDRFSDLTKEAATRLENASAATHIVEGAFVRAWEERARFATPEDLDAFLHEAVHQGAVRAQSRRAMLHRFEAHEGVHPATSAVRAEPPRAEDAWAHVESALHARAASPEAAAHERADHARHATAEHVAAATKRRPWLWPAVGAVAAVLVVLAALFGVGRASEDAAIASSFELSGLRTHTAAPGQRAIVTLADGSDVTLGGDSKLRVPPRFSGKLRAVKLEGTATFVASAGQNAFHVLAGPASIKVVGTTFDVRAYPTEDVVTVRVREGQVAVRSAKQSRTLAAGKALAIASDGTMSEPSAAELEETLGWTNGRLVIAGRPLREALPQVERWFALEIKVLDATLLDRVVTMNVALDSSRSAIAALETSAGVKVAYEGRVRVLRDGTAKRVTKETTPRR